MEETPPGSDVSLRGKDVLFCLRKRENTLGNTNSGANGELSEKEEGKSETF